MSKEKAIETSEAVAHIGSANQVSDFEERKLKAIKAMDDILKLYHVGINLVLAGMPYGIQPMINYVDLKEDNAKNQSKTGEDK